MSIVKNWVQFCVLLTGWLLQQIMFESYCEALKNNVGIYWNGKVFMWWCQVKNLITHSMTQFVLCSYTYKKIVNITLSVDGCLLCFCLPAFSLSVLNINCVLKKYKFKIKNSVYEKKTINISDLTGKHLKRHVYM